MLTLPCTFDDPQVMGDQFAFELIDENRHRSWLESIVGTESATKAINGWNFSSHSGPDMFRFTRVIKRRSDDAYICYVESALSKITETSWRIINAGRFMPESLRDRGDLTRSIATEYLDYIFNRFPLHIEEFSLMLPPGIDISKRVPISPSETLYFNVENPELAYSEHRFSREHYFNNI